MQVLRRGSALAVAPAAEQLALTGPDAARFLNGYVTCDVARMTPGQASRGFLTGLKGQVLSDLDLLVEVDGVRLRLPAGYGARVREHLARYQLADRFELSAAEPLERLLLRGETAPATLAAAELPAPETGKHGTGAGLTVVRTARPGEPRFELWGEHAPLSAARTALTAAGVVGVDPVVFEVARVEDGELAFGVDYGDDAFPQESGDLDAVSFTKGCYLGQEVVARIHYRGGVQRVPRRLLFPQEVALAGDPRGRVLLHEGRPAGTVTSAVGSPELGRIGLALVHRRVGEPPLRLELEGGGAVELFALPDPPAA